MHRAMEKPRAYVAIFVALIALTGATVVLCHFNLGVMHGAAGLGIAVAKAVLIMLFFMHLWRSKPMIWVVALSGLFWLCILLTLTMTDMMSRVWIPIP